VQSIAVVLNANAGAADGDAAARIETAFAAAGCLVNVHHTPPPQLADVTRRLLHEGARIVVAAGGDGTISAVASALAGTGTTLGVLPMGTLNHFAKDIGMAMDLDAAARAIVRGRTREVDVGVLNDRCFVNNASIGVYARLLAERENRQRDGSGKWIAHAMAAARVMGAYRPVRAVVRSEGGNRAIRTPFVFVGNNEYQLNGIELGGRRDLTGGRLHVCMAPGMSRAGVAGMIAAAVFGRIRNVATFEAFLARTVEIDVPAAQIHASLDGEVVPLSSPLRFAIRPGALRVIDPAEAA
jgi:diacylglycerol kinase family enzyme